MIFQMKIKDCISDVVSPPVDYEEASKDEEGGESKNWADYGNDRQAENNC